MTTTTAPPPATHWATRAWNAAGLIVTAIIALLWLAPLLWAANTAFKPEGETTLIPLTWWSENFTWEAFEKTFIQSNMLRWFLNSTVVAVGVTALVLITAAMAAYGFSRTRFRGKGAVFAFVVAGVMVPPQVLVVPLYDEMLALGLVDTYWAMILPQVAAPVMVFILKKFFDGIPHELEEAARVDGASQWRIFWQVVLPLSRPALAAVGIFTFIFTWNNFFWPFLAVSDPDLMTIPVGLATIQSSYGLRYAQIMASAVLGGLPLLIAYVFFQRNIIRSIAHTGLSGT
ncbi:multiple sugar transport system permease protein [Thermocatellispora tengchongensis]|uniref:Multiple sugar transport system permease protein n=1 Tax=Thermocatellispora tengchongensis TaxID=1073253 RepID=A0A840PCC9_9ACTN|nr:carbohydrate ABC transporter permease [Thermocatellispora tengchongensis]MBB5135080.1 multiple sugar transport system permease protein [Thermocatellispora tengchongensis]